MCCRPSLRPIHDFLLILLTDPFIINKNCSFLDKLAYIWEIKYILKTWRIRMNLASRKWWGLSWRKDTNINQVWGQSSLRTSRPQPTLRKPSSIIWIGKMILWRMWNQVRPLDFSCQLETSTQFSIFTIIVFRTQTEKILTFLIPQPALSKTHRKILERLRAGPVQELSNDLN